MIEVNHHTFTSLFNHLHSFVQLFTTITTLRGKNITRCTRRMYTHQDRLIGIPNTFKQSYMFQAVGFLAKSDKTEITVFGRHIHLNPFFYN